MDTVDASVHYSQAIDEKPSLLVLILDTNPYAWSTLSATLPLERALASILIFLNAHLAFSHANRVAVIASHTKSARFLYPTTTTTTTTTAAAAASGSEDPLRDANKYRQFRIIEDQVQASFAELMNQTTAGELVDAKETMMAGALGLALGYVNRLVRVDDGGVLGAGAAGEVTSMNARILVISVSGDLAEQYVPVMNSIFAAQRKKIPIDICKVAGETVFLQQASDTTRGIYMQLEHPENLLQYLMMCFIPDTATRRHLVPPTQINVDFRAACFCHKNVVDIGFVCSICLSIFCTPPEGAICTTCNTKLDISALGNFGGNPAVVLTKKKKTKKLKQSKATSFSNEASATSTPGTPAS
ncbi:transcription factor Tfb4 [Tuber magnatum]|uniref:General transcription and DNA repair factor IIH subunit TFB4 n=1 Tax=Tuber magnatum TaxID=42249 RepID=A0A317SIR3_9PEZI|nr:transcription factor Tfb4 [Tuber magnatum]